MEEISYSGKLTLDELAAALRMGSLLKKWHIIVYLLILAIILIGISTNLKYGQSFIYFLTPIMLLLIIGASFYFAPAISANKAFDEDSEFKHPLSGIISDEGLSIQAIRSLAQLKWILFKSARLSPEYILLYQTNNCFNVFRRKFFANEADWKAFRSLVEQKIAKKIYFEKDPTAPLFSRFARQRNFNFLIFGVLLLIIVITFIYNFAFYTPNL